MDAMSFSPGRKDRLTPFDLPRFPSESLFDRLARVVCRAGCLPRKELYEAWEVARRVHRRFRGGRVVDLAAEGVLRARPTHLTHASFSDPFWQMRRSGPRNGAHNPKFIGSNPILATKQIQRDRS